MSNSPLLHCPWKRFAGISPNPSLNPLRSSPFNTKFMFNLTQTFLSISCPRGFFHLIKNHKPISLTTPSTMNPSVILNNQVVERNDRHTVLKRGSPEPSHTHLFRMACVYGLWWFYNMAYDSTSNFAHINFEYFKFHYFRKQTSFFLIFKFNSFNHHLFFLFTLNFSCHSQQLPTHPPSCRQPLHPHTPLPPSLSNRFFISRLMV